MPAIFVYIVWRHLPLRYRLPQHGTDRLPATHAVADRRTTAGRVADCLSFGRQEFSRNTYRLLSRIFCVPSSAHTRYAERDDANRREGLSGSPSTYGRLPMRLARIGVRSEEHTSELQSLR